MESVSTSAAPRTKRSSALPSFRDSHERLAANLRRAVHRGGCHDDPTSDDPLAVRRHVRFTSRVARQPCRGRERLHRSLRAFAVCGAEDPRDCPRTRLRRPARRDRHGHGGLDRRSDALRRGRIRRRRRWRAAVLSRPFLPRRCVQRLVGADLGVRQRYGAGRRNAAALSLMQIDSGSSFELPSEAHCVAVFASRFLWVCSHASTCDSTYECRASTVMNPDAFARAPQRRPSMTVAVKTPLRRSSSSYAYPPPGAAEKTTWPVILLKSRPNAATERGSTSPLRRSFVRRSRHASMKMSDRATPLRDTVSRTSASVSAVRW